MGQPAIQAAMDAISLLTLQIDHVADNRLQSLLEFWLEARDRSPVPTIDKIDPLAFHTALSNIWMCDVVEGDPRGRWRYRLVGDEVRLAYGRNIVGETLESITDASAIDRVTRYFAIATDWPAVVHVGGRLYSETDYPASGERIILPFADPATGLVCRLLGATYHSWLERGYPTGGVPLVQTRTYTPVDGSPAQVETFEQPDATED
ncbi:MAG: PAS domain-containing protein [Thalassobaculum sp.]